ncbi:ATP-binding protein [Spartinivicinus poritis]|uniref:histidine kinase n=1 Tax=Spartinivicinus poritis TaxID=2994640 RepID=A0ABT5UEW6_9GAMM|nr:ATP-binding protein [Spartinivicinus sp. A2-2]MDE1463634.1 ATP-binding protein [Spartinivicinus sp. A2-2]
MKRFGSIRTKMLMFPICFLLVMLLVSSNFVYIYIEQSFFVKEFQEQKLDHYAQLIHAYSEFATNHALIYDSLREFQLGIDKQSYYRNVQDRLKSAENALNCVSVLAEEISNTDKAFPADKLNSLISNMTSYNAMTSSLFRQAFTNVDNAYTAMAQLTLKYSEIIKKFSGLMSSLDQNLAERAGLVESHAKSSLIVFLCITFVSCTLVFLLSVFYVRKTAKRLSVAIASIKEMTSGKLSRRCEVESNDEIGELAKEVNYLAESLEYAKAVGEEKSSFLANMSHEIRTPLNGVLATAELLLETPNTNNERSSYIKLIYQSSKSLLSVIDDILVYSSLEAGKVTIENKKFPLKKLLEEMKLLFSQSAEQKNVKFFLKCNERVADYYIGDEGRLRQILLHLVGNAVKFTYRGCIVVDVDSVVINYKNCIFINVRDTGIGINEKHINNIFKGFYQVEHTSTRNYGGSGLGLAISHQLTQLLNGELLVSSKPGEGSTFTLKLPLEPAVVSESTVTSDMADKKQARDYNKHVLVVDDTPSNQMIARAVLNKLGFSVVITENGKAAITQILNQQFDIVFMDMHMPVLDGIEATKQIRKLAGKKGKIPIIALTANVMPEDKDLCLEAGMNGVITKPITKAKIASEIDRILSYETVEENNSISDVTVVKGR